MMFTDKQLKDNTTEMLRFLYRSASRSFGATYTDSGKTKQQILSYIVTKIANNGKVKDESKLPDDVPFLYEDGYLVPLKVGDLLIGSLSFFADVHDVTVLDIGIKKGDVFDTFGIITTNSGEVSKRYTIPFNLIVDDSFFEKGCKLAIKSDRDLSIYDTSLMLSLTSKII